MAAKLIDVRGLPETRKLLASYTDRQMDARLRRGERAGAKVMRTELRWRAASPEFPRSFRKTVTRSRRNPPGVSVRPVSPLVSIFEGGAKQHPIGAAGQVLANPEAGFFARGPVSHPGMAARPLVGPAFEAAVDEAADAAMDVIFDGRPGPI